MGHWATSNGPIVFSFGQEAGSPNRVWPSLIALEVNDWWISKMAMPWANGHSTRARSGPPATTENGAPAQPSKPGLTDANLGRCCVDAAP